MNYYKIVSPETKGVLKLLGIRIIRIDLVVYQLEDLAIHKISSRPIFYT